MNNFTPLLNQAISHPEHNWLLFRGFARDALGLKNSQEQAFRKQLAQGYDWVKMRGSDHIERIFYTAQGLTELCIKVNSDRAEAFRRAIALYRPGNNSAIVRAESAQVASYQQPTQSVATYQTPEAYYPEVFPETYHSQVSEPEIAALSYQPVSQSPQALQQINHHYYVVQQQAPAEAPRQPTYPEPTQHIHIHAWNDPRGFFDWLGVTVAFLSFTCLAFLAASLIVNLGASLQQPRQMNIRIQSPEQGVL